jgi:ATP:ADP antiporter, AAA family
MLRNMPETVGIPTEDEIETEAQSSGIFKVARCEIRRFFFVSLIFFLISYIYSVSRDMKDAVVIDRLDPSSIPYLKILIVLPINVIFVLILQKHIQNSSAYQGLSLSIFIFGSFFVFYGVVLMSFRDFIEPNPLLTRDWFVDNRMMHYGLQWLSTITLTVTLGHRLYYAFPPSCGVTWTCNIYFSVLQMKSVHSANL